MVLDVARKAIHTEALALKHLEASLGEDFVRAVDIILESKGISAKVEIDASATE